MLEIIKAQYRDGYKIWVEFNDGKSGVIDISEALWGPMFEPLKNVEQFKRFEVSAITHTVTWENGADLAPEYLREKLITAAREPASASRLG